MCIYCYKDIDISHGGRYDIERHDSREVHIKNARLFKSTAPLKFANPPDQTKDKMELEVVRAETTVALMIAHLNLPLLVLTLFRRLSSRFSLIPR